jgi:prepilin peptidase CpaA
MALLMMVHSGKLKDHLLRTTIIAHEIITVRDPVELSRLAAARKPSMTLLPYGIPLATGTIGYLAWEGLLL